jgi:hypothetical protein
MEQMGEVLAGVQAAMRAQLRVVAALQASTEGPAAGASEEMAAQLAELRKTNEDLSSRIEWVEDFLTQPSSAAGGGAGQAGGDARSAGGELGDELVEPEGGDVDRGDEGMR